MSDRLLLYKYKGDSCEYCGTTVEEMIRKFQSYARFKLHHIDPAKKSPEYDNLIRRNLSSEQLDEVDKCALLCGNCHDTLHSQNITLPVSFTLQGEGHEPIEHVLDCQVIYDHEKNEATIFSDEFRFLDLYRVQIGTEPASIMSGIQLKPVLNPLHERTRTDGELVISTMNGTVVYRVTPINDTQCEVEAKLEFPFIKVDLPLVAADGKRWDIFLRSGTFLSSGNHRLFAPSYGRMTVKVTTTYKAANDPPQTE